MIARAEVMRFLRSPTARLSASYLGIILLMSLSFSVVLYRTSSHELGRQLPPVLMDPGRSFMGPDFTPYHDFFARRIAEGQQRLLGRLILLNSIVLIGGAFLSYYLARRTLAPIEEAMQSQARFASDASHELRTPLTVIQAENEIALRGPGLTLKRAKELLHSNVEEVIRLRDLSTGLLRLAGEPDPTAFTAVWLDTVATDALNQIVKRAQTKYIAIEDTMPHTVVDGDRQGLVQAVAILLDNAVKYSPEHTTIYLGGRAQGRFVYLTVRDQGIGIDAAHLPHIFERFYRADEARNKRGADGYGLGLAIAYKIIGQHHGKLSAESTPGQGSTFTIKLPRQDLSFL